MIPPLLLPALTKSTLLTTAAAASCMVLFCAMDANPTLYVYDKLLHLPHLRHRLHLQRLQGQRVWITGASSGIGAALAVQMSSHGAKLILSSRNKDGKLEEVARQCCLVRPKSLMHQEHEKENVIVLPLDVTAKDDILHPTIDKAFQHFSGLDMIVLNAGRTQQSPATMTSPSATQDLMDVNFGSLVRCVHYVMQKDSWNAPSSKNNHQKRNKKHIVVTSSVAGKVAVPLSSSYAAAKHAVHGYFASLRCECPWLRVDLACPGPVDTGLFDKAVKVGTKPQHYQEPLPPNQEESLSEKNKHEMKMTTSRCAQLILSGMLGPSNLFYETWIQKQPLLTFSYLAQHCPGVANAVLQRMGVLRVAMWRYDLPLYDARSLKVAKELLAKEGREEL